VVGGGLLGVEAACGLRARGLDVTLVHHRDRLLDRQLSGPAAGVVLAAVADLGIRVWLGARPAEVRTRFGRVHELLLADGRCVPADLVLLACGARPDTALARAAGLGTSHGVLVGDDLTSPDDARVHAIGDCAQPPQGCSGLVAPGWSQARRLARRLAGADPEAGSAGGSAGRSGPGPVVRLKAVGLDVLTLGDPPGAGDPPGRRTVTLHDPQGHRHVDVSVRDGRVVAATCVGAGDVAADLTVAFDRQTPTPPDPAAMLLGSSLAGGAPAGSPTAMPAGATVCRCNGVTKADVVAAWEGGAAQVDDVAARTRAGTGCGGCRGVIQGLLDWLDQAEPDRTRPDRTRPDRTREPAVPTRLT
jgi:assimilatory nitrate reductase electron transfer subunit